LFSQGLPAKPTVQDMLTVAAEDESHNSPSQSPVHLHVQVSLTPVGIPPFAQACLLGP